MTKKKNNGFRRKVRTPQPQPWECSPQEREQGKEWSYRPEKQVELYEKQMKGKSL